MAEFNTDDERRAIDAIDSQMAELFERRMEAARQIGLKKKQAGRPVEDLAREREMIGRRASQLGDKSLEGHYRKFLQSVIDISKECQSDIVFDGLPDIVIERGAIARAGEKLGIDGGKVLLVSDTGVPEEHIRKVAASLEGRCSLCAVHTFPCGERHKSLETYAEVMHSLLEHGFTRTDAVVAVGGGVVGDLAGFAAATFMRGIRFYNIPTTLLSQVDSSVGGKTAVDFGGVKNIVGAFHMPRRVLIDPDTLFSLPERQLHNGLVEAIKMGATSDAQLFSLIENSVCLHDDLSEIIRRSLLVKSAVVQADPKEGGLRRVLNFGHSVGHAIEAAGGGEYLHGEAVGLGMLCFCSPEVRRRIAAVLEKYGLPTTHDIPAETLRSLIAHDKKASGKELTVVRVDEIGSFSFQKIDIDALKL